MTRSIPIDFKGNKPVFNFSDRAKDFACTGQRAAVLVSTLRGSADLHPEAGTRLPAVPGTTALTSPEKLNALVLEAQEAVKTDLKSQPTPYPYEHCSQLKMRATRTRPERASVAMAVYSREGVYYGSII
jgi:hypothetical protein